ncbi:MAG TPA: DUF4333 domain-containing protein [Pseudolysinimonas sp.]|jgi:hypothetical protein
MSSRPVAPLLGAALAGAALVLALVGCSASAEAGPTVSGSKLAATASKALAEKVGTTPEMDCGTDDIIIVKGKKVTCELTDTDGLIYDVAVTFTSVTGSTYHIDVKVADTAKNAPTPTVDPGSSPTVKGTDIAQLAAQALTPSLQFTPDISCADEDVPIAVGNTEECAFTDPSGSDHDVLVTITKFDGSNYSIDAKVTD